MSKPILYTFGESVWAAPPELAVRAFQLMVH
ncbi:hypothetical protein Moror_16728 [Moniliophthora roreri MCA 2997]|uniref:Uncharacterized protein n=1 Tax=Moniliophthora roreri (strain MCA 2997) TaxID=1381753 RepID=V2XQN6_MONRO|nr:hypothetical protein Moror_16728 [Moniliophthora roreri MCA 2997]